MPHIPRDFRYPSDTLENKDLVSDMIAPPRRPKQPLRTSFTNTPAYF